MSRSVFPHKAIQPCLPKPAKEPPAGSEWIHEIKHDGFRILARRNATGVWLYTRSNFADRFPRIVEAVKSLPVQSCFIDGEAIVIDGNGLSVFELYAPLIWAGCGNLPKTSQANFRFAFDRGGAFNGGSCPRERGETLMSWTTPVLIEVCIGLEINGYLPAEL
jgi:hypothetical protein